MKLRYLILAALVAVLFASCGTTKLTRAEAFPAFYEEEKPVTVLVMPPINQTTNVDAKDYFYYTLNRPVANDFFYVYPPMLAMQTLQEESAYDSELFIEGDISKFGELFGADLETEHGGEGNEKDERPDRGDQELVFLPPLAFDEREDGDGKQHTHKWDDAPDGEQFSDFHERTWQSGALRPRRHW